MAENARVGGRESASRVERTGNHHTASNWRMPTDVDRRSTRRLSCQERTLMTLSVNASSLDVSVMFAFIRGWRMLSNASEASSSI